jgi:hypothetical protein
MTNSSDLGHNLYIQRRLLCKYKICLFKKLTDWYHVAEIYCIANLTDSVILSVRDFLGLVERVFYIYK